jgi:fumarylacetoacetate (FAA) hydrolase
MHSPLPRAYEWIDGSAYINHVVLVRKARNAELPETLKTDPLIYQGGSGTFLAPTQDIAFPTEAWGTDFESEVAVIVGDVPRGTKAADALGYVRLVMIVNDVTLRNLIPDELAKGFGFFNSKPSTAFAPFAVTPDELGEAWSNGRVHLPLVTKLNGDVFGDPEAGPEMWFGFAELIEHITKTRALTAGTIIGSGTVSNEDVARGSSCLAEKRMLEKINTGTMTTPFLKFGDRVEIEMVDAQGRSIFGRITQTFVQG